MGITVKFYKFNKRVNSTLQPTSAGTTISNVVLKDNVSIATPILFMKSISKEYNYCYIEDFGRYYWVQHVEIAYNNMYYYYLTVDALASWQSAIKSRSKYVIRTADSNYYNLFLKDDTWVHTERPTFTTTTISDLNDWAVVGDGTYVISVVNADTHNTINPSSKMYAITPSNLKTLFSILYDLDSYSDFDIDDLTATYFNPGQYITSVRWYPFALSSIASGTSHYLDIGWYNTNSDLGTGVAVWPITSYGKTDTYTFTLPGASNWTDLDTEWTTYSLYLPGCGWVDIDPIFAGHTITLTMYVDFNTGAVYAIGKTGGNLVFETNGEFGADVQMNQVSGDIDFSRLGSNFASTLATIGLGVTAQGSSGAVSDTVSSYLSSIGANMASNYAGEYRRELNDYSQQYLNNSINSGKEVANSVKNAIVQTVLNPTVTSNGSNGARYTILNNHTIILCKRHFNHYNTDSFDDCGVLCHKDVTLGNLSGYTVVANGNIRCQATIEERNTICQMLEGGFYAEWNN